MAGHRRLVRSDRAAGAALSLGYTRTFELLGLHGLTERTTIEALPTMSYCDAIELDADERTVRLPAGTMLDPGGIGKGLACDLVAAQLLAGGAAGALVDLGGDVRVTGESPDGTCWTIAVDDAFVDPYGDERADEVSRLHLLDGVVATSSTLRRRWEHDDPADHRRRTVHHLLDPHTGQPADTGIVAATVVAADAVTADVVAKAALVAGRLEGPAIIDALDTAGLLVTESGDLLATSNLARFTRGQFT